MGGWGHREWRYESCPHLVLIDLDRLDLSDRAEVCGESHEGSHEPTVPSPPHHCLATQLYPLTPESHSPILAT